MNGMAHRVGELAACRGWSALMETRNSKSRKRKEMRVVVATLMVAFTLSAWGCGSTYPSGNPVQPAPPATPAPTPAPSSGAVTINIVGVNGAQSFSPNPATLPAGQLVVWLNVDTTTHRVVLDDRSVDTGDLAPGASSQPMAIGAGGGRYHCSIHPEMIGSINQDTPTPTSPPPPSY